MCKSQQGRNTVRHLTLQCNIPSIERGSNCKKKTTDYQFAKINHGWPDEVEYSTSYGPAELV